MNKILASSKTCGSCQVLKKQLEELNIDVEVKDMSEDPQFFCDHKIKTLPTLVVDNGTLMVYGSNTIFKYLKE